MSNVERHEEVKDILAALMGEWNGWKSVPMTKSDNGVWTARVTLSSGTYAYKFLINGSDWVFDPDNSAKKSVDGIENSAGRN